MCKYRQCIGNVILPNYNYVLIATAALKAHLGRDKRYSDTQETFLGLWSVKVRTMSAGYPNMSQAPSRATVKYPIVRCLRVHMMKNGINETMPSFQMK